MASTPTPEEAVERAQRAQEGRISAISALAQARQNVTDVQEDTDRQRAELEAQISQRLGDAEREDLKAYNAALTAGWSAEELKKIGFAEPAKKARTRRRTARKTPAKQLPTPAPEAPPHGASEAESDSTPQPSEAA